MGREEHRGEGHAAQVDTFTAPTTPIVVVLRVGDAWLVGVGKRAPHGFRCPCLVSPHGSLDRLKSLIHYFLYIKLQKTDETGLGTIGLGRAGRAGRAGSETWGVLLVPSSSPTLSPIYDGLDVNVTYNVTWFHLNHDMVSRRICKLSFYGGHSITLAQCAPLSGYVKKMPHTYMPPPFLALDAWLSRNKSKRTRNISSWPH